MERLKLSDLRIFSALVRGLYVLRPLDEFLAFVTAELSALIPCDTATYNHLVLRRRHITWVQNPPNYIQNHLGPEAQQIADCFTRTHPIVCYHRRTRNHRPVKISDLPTRRQFHDLPVYREFFNPINVEHQLSILLSASSRLLTGLCVSSHDLDFSERDRLLLALLRPHLLQAYRNAEAVTLLRQAASRGAAGLVLLSLDRDITDVDVRASLLLGAHFGRVRPGGSLPEPLARWVAQQEHAFKTPGDAPPPIEPFVTERDGKRLVVRLFPGSLQRPLLVTEYRTAADPPGLEPLGLSRREAEVLRWVAEGKKNEEVAAILGLSPRTVPQARRERPADARRGDAGRPRPRERLPFSRSHPLKRSNHPVNAFARLN